MLDAPARAASAIGSCTSIVAAVVVVVLTVLLAAPRAAHAAEPAMVKEARAHLERGLAAYGEKDWERAILEFRAGYEIDPRPEFLFAWAQAERLSGDCAAAIELYDRFVSTGPSPEQTEAAQQMSARCRESVAPAVPVPVPARPAPAPAPAPAATVPAPAPAAPANEGAWWKDGWGATLTGVGLVGVGVGVGYLVAAGSSEDAAERAASYDEYAFYKEEAADHRTFATIGLGVGVAFLATAGVRYYLAGRRADGPRGVALAPLPGGGALVFGGSF